MNCLPQLETKEVPTWSYCSGCYFEGADKHFCPRWVDGNLVCVSGSNKIWVVKEKVETNE